MPNIIPPLEDQIKEFAKKHSASETRKEIGRVFGLKKSARNAKFIKMFGQIDWVANEPNLFGYRTIQTAEVPENGEPIHIDDKVYRLDNGSTIKVGKPEDKIRGLDCPKVDIKGDEATVETKQSSQIYTLEELIKVSGIDMNEWTVKSFIANSYGDNFQAKAEFVKRKDGPTFQQIVEELKEDSLNFSQNVDKITYTPDSEGLLLEIAAFDLHLGKLGWKASDGGDWDMSIAKETFKAAIIELVGKARKIGNISKICFPIGNDYLTCDNSSNTTHALTPQSVDSRFPKVFKEGRKLLVWAIDYLKQFAPVDVVYVVSNHDTDSMFHLADALECWYRNDQNVSIENSPAPRKYYRFQNNLIVYDHGDKVAPQKLAVVASLECKDWSAVEHRELHVGHRHHEKSMTIGDEDLNSCILRVIPALSGSDYYHNSHGYVGAKQRAQAFVWHPQNGLETILYSKSCN